MPKCTEPFIPALFGGEFVTPLAVDYPLSGDPWDACVYYPSGTTFGDELFTLCTVPPGFHLEVVTQPANGIVTFDGSNGWHYAIADTATLGPDSFTYRVTNGTTHSNTATVLVQLVDT